MILGMDPTNTSMVKLLKKKEGVNISGYVKLIWNYKRFNRGWQSFQVKIKK